IPPNNYKLTYVYDRRWHYNESFGCRVPFVFLQGIQSKFLSAYTKLHILNASAYSMNTFNKVIQKRMNFYSNDNRIDKLKQVQGGIVQVKDVMTHNIEQVLGRDRRIDIVADRTDALDQKAFVFKRRSILLKVKLLKK
ncbi:hypothetical protein INT46_005778, partial [Mucor plumbeus]